MSCVLGPHHSPGDGVRQRPRHVQAVRQLSEQVLSLSGASARQATQDARAATGHTAQAVPILGQGMSTPVLRRAPRDVLRLAPLPLLPGRGQLLHLVREPTLLAATC